MGASFADRASAAGIDLDPEAIAKLERFRDLLLAATRRFNLTSLREAGAIEQRHLLESLALGRLLVAHGLLSDGARVLDIGSGAGLPGQPLKIDHPGLDLALLEANAKKCAFLREAVAALGLEGVAVLEGRAEDRGRDAAHRDAYDLVLARAVAPMPVHIEYALPFLRPGGRLAAAKGSAARSEIAASDAALAALGGELAATSPFEPPGGEPQTLVVVRKLAATPPRFPRRAGVAAKRPLR